jgi:hypothetical protein
MLRRNNSKARNLALAVWMPGSIGTAAAASGARLDQGQRQRLTRATATPIEPGTLNTGRITFDRAESVRLTVHADEDRFDQTYSRLG